MKTCATCKYLGSELTRSKLRCKLSSERITPHDACSAWQQRSINLGYSKKPVNYNRIRG